MQAVAREDSSIRADIVSLSELYSRCLKSFVLLLVSLEAESCRPVRLNFIDIARVEEEYGRLAIWGEQTKANLPAHARGSLDDGLRGDENVKGLVRAILLRLDAVLRQALDLANVSPDGDASASDYNSASSMDSGSEAEEDTADRHQEPKICVLFRSTADQIRSLFELSSILERPIIERKWIRSARKREDRSHADDALQLHEAYATFDLLHVLEKIHAWRGLGKDGSALPFEDESIRSPDGGSNTIIGKISDIFWLCERLAMANSRRREQLCYWADHPYGPSPSVRSKPMPEELGHGFRTVTLPVHPDKRNDDDKSTVKPPTSSAPTRKQNSHPSTATSGKTFFSTAAVSDAQEDIADSVRARTIYAPTAASDRRLSSNRVPDAPKRTAADENSIICPYCGMELENEIVNSRDEWKRHVFRDLRPYICTYSDCRAPEKMFVRRTDWMYHELQMHRRQFICRDCGEAFADKENMSQHLTTTHRNLFSLSQVPFALRLCNAPLDQDSVQVCVLCGEEMSLVTLQRHLAAHLEDLALFVLPTDVDKDAIEEGDSDVSNRVAGKNVHSWVNTKASPDARSLELSEPLESASSRLLFDGQRLTSIDQLANQELNYVHKTHEWLTREEVSGDITHGIAAAEKESRHLSFANTSETTDPDVWGFLCPMRDDDSNVHVLRKRPPQSAGQRLLREPQHSNLIERHDAGWYEVAAGGCVLGHSVDCDVIVDDPLDSNLHCLIYLDTQADRSRVFVLDNSTNGTFVDDWIVGKSQHRQLLEGDKIAVSGKHRFIFRQPDYRKRKEDDTFTKSYSLGKMTRQVGHPTSYFCVANSTGKRYVVKMYPRFGDQTMSISSALTDYKHRNIQVIKDILATSHRIYVVTEVARGGDLGQYLRLRLKLREPEARYIIRQLFYGLEYLHDRHVAHRYIELETVLFAENPPEGKDFCVQLSSVGIPAIVGEDYFIHHWPNKKVYAAPELLNNSAEK